MGSYTTISMTNVSRLHLAIWALIYGGLLTLVVAYFASPHDAALASWLSVAGGVAAAIGVALLLYRASIKDSK